MLASPIADLAFGHLDDRVPSGHFEWERALDAGVAGRLAEDELGPLVCGRVSTQVVARWSTAQLLLQAVHLRGSTSSVVLGVFAEVDQEAFVDELVDVVAGRGGVTAECRGEVGELPA